MTARTLAMRYGPWLGLLLLSACSSPVVRLRLPIGLRVREVDGLTIHEASWSLRAVRLRGGEAAPTDLGWTAVSPSARSVAAVPDPIPWTIGESEPTSMNSDAKLWAFAAAYRAVDVVVRGDLVLEGQAESGAAISWSLSLPDLESTSLSRVAFGDAAKGEDSPLVIVELGGEAWRTAAVAALASGAAGSLTPDDAAHDGLVEAMLVDVHVAIDRDDDGRLGDAERKDALLTLSPVAQVDTGAAETGSP